MAGSLARDNQTRSRHIGGRRGARGREEKERREERKEGKRRRVGVECRLERGQLAKGCGEAQAQGQRLNT
jgi:hypothetical protein